MSGGECEASRLDRSVLTERTGVHAHTGGRGVPATGQGSEGAEREGGGRGKGEEIEGHGGSMEREVEVKSRGKE